MARQKKNKGIQWTEVFGLGRNNSYKIPLKFLLKIPGHIFIDLEGLDAYKEDGDT
jgi:hypothetical protein